MCTRLSPDRTDRITVDLVPDLAHHQNSNVVDIVLATPDVGKPHQFKAETVFAGLRVEFAKPARRKAAEQAKDRGVPVTNPSGWPLIENQAILVWDEGSLQTYWLDGRRSASVAGSA